MSHFLSKTLKYTSMSFQTKLNSLSRLVKNSNSSKKLKLREKEIERPQKLMKSKVRGERINKNSVKYIEELMILMKFDCIIQMDRFQNIKQVSSTQNYTFEPTSSTLINRKSIESGKVFK
jgi:hypothetical protein